MTHDRNRESKNPSKFTEDVRNRYLDLLKLGYGRLVAAETIDIHPETIRRYYHGTPSYLEDIQNAEGMVVDRAQKQLIDMMDAGEFAATKMILERLDRAKWADRASQHVKVEIEGQIDHNHVKGLPPGDAVAEMEKLIASRMDALAIEAEVIDPTTGESSS